MSKELSKAIELIKDFKKRFLDNNIYNLKDFSFLNLNRTKQYLKIENVADDDIHKFGYFNNINGKWRVRSYNSDDYDDMNITRAIYYVLFYKRLPNITWKDFEWEYKNWDEIPNDTNYRGETINSFHTLINEELYKTYFLDLKCGKELIKKIDDFLYDAFSIGNFMLLPNKKIGKQNINQYKGIYLGDYFDRFLYALKNRGTNEMIDNFIEINKPVFDLNNFDDFIEKNYLDNYIENGKINIDFSPHTRYWNKIEDKEKYALFIGKYITEATKRIKNRAKVLCEELDKKIKQVTN